MAALSKLLDPKYLAKGMVITKAKRFAAQLYDGVLGRIPIDYLERGWTEDQLQAARALARKKLRWLIENERPLSEFVTEPMIATCFGVSVDELNALRSQWGWTTRAVTDQEFLKEVLPVDARTMIESKGELGTKWAKGLIAWIRKEMGG